jgi:acetyl-CoA C-acetyltransferase
MAFEIYTQLLGRAGERQLGGVRLGLTHNLDGAPFSSIVAVSIFGRLH